MSGRRQRSPTKAAPTAAAERQRRHRELMRTGGAVLPIVVPNLAALAEALQEAGRLDRFRWGMETREEIAAAVERLLAEFCHASPDAEFEAANVPADS